MEGPRGRLSVRGEGGVLVTRSAGAGTACNHGTTDPRDHRTMLPRNYRTKDPENHMQPWKHVTATNPQNHDLQNKNP